MSQASPHLLIANVFFAPYSYGGATIVAEQVARHISKAYGWRVSVLSAQSRSDLAPYSVIKSQAPNGIVNYLINLPQGRSYAEVYDNPNVTEATTRLLHRLKPDLMHIHCIQDLGIGALNAAKVLNVPTILSVHDFWWLCERQFMIRPNEKYCAQDPIQIDKCNSCVDDLSRARTRLTRLQAAAAQADIITYPSEFARGLSRRSGMDRTDDTVWQNGVLQPGPNFFDMQADRRANDGRVVFGFVGGPSHIKGWPLMRTAFEKIKRTDFKGYLVDGSLDGSWWPGQRTDRLKGEWATHPRYSQDTMDEFWSKIDVLLFLSQWKETFGLTVREALSRGVRVIQTQSGGTTEHKAADQVGMIPIGAGYKDLLPHLTAEIDRGHKPSEPTPVHSFAQQADAFVTMAQTLLHHKQPKRS